MKYKSNFTDQIGNKYENVLRHFFSFTCSLFFKLDGRQTSRRDDSMSEISCLCDTR